MIGPGENSVLHQNFYVFTGGPGSGKTTLLNVLAIEGFIIVPEAAREIIKTQEAINGDGLPWKNKTYYTDLMLNRSVTDYKKIATQNNEHPGLTYFFDRGILDTLCYSEMIGDGITDEMNSFAEKYRYNSTVFMFPPWQEIYEPDAERKQSWQEAVFTYERMRNMYMHYNYKMLEVPKGSVDYRKNFILKQINKQ